MKFLLTSLVAALAVTSFAAPVSRGEYLKLRTQALNRKRAVIFNNDGCDSYLYPRSRLPFTIEKFLQLRTSPLKGSHVKTISYCTLSSSFGQFTHATKVGEHLTNTHKRKGRINVTPEFAKLGTDPLKEVIKYAQANKMEVFWSNRVNDTHDSGHRPDKPYERWSKLKQAHPEWLMGKSGQRFPSGRWSAVDFTHPEIRDLAVKYITEVCENYDIDGVELDFFRHLYLFKSVVKGGKASASERAMLTEMIRKIRRMTERVGMKKGKAILVAIRVPDSVEYCRDLGIDLRQWLKEGLVDIIIGSGYFRLNPWKYLVKLGHKYQVKVYAGLSEPRVRNEHRKLRRQNKLVYRARAAQALHEGVDGIYLFNQFSVSSPRMSYLREIGKPEILSKKNKLYFVTCRDGNPSRDLTNGVRHRQRPVLTPGHPASLAGKPYKGAILVGNDGKVANAQLLFNTAAVAAKSLNVSLNDVKLQLIKAEPGLAIYQIPANTVKAGSNHFKVSAKQGAAMTQLLLKGDKKLTWQTQGLWRRLFSGVPRVEKIVDGNYLLGDLGTDKNIYNLIYPWQASPSTKNILTFKAKVKSTTAPEAVCVRFSNSRYAEYLLLEANRISLKYAAATRKLNTTDKFHDYKLQLDKNRIRVYVDGKLILASTMNAPYTKDAAVFALAGFRTDYMASNSMIIGSMSGPGTGEAYWKDVKLSSSNPRLLDAALLIIKDPTEPEVAQFKSIKHESLTKQTAKLQTALKVDYHASGGKLPQKPWRARYYNKQNARITNGVLLLDHSGSGKQEYCSFDYYLGKNVSKCRLLQIDLALKLTGKTDKPQFTLIASLPSKTGGATVWSFKFSNNGVSARDGRKNSFSKVACSAAFNNFRALFDPASGRAEIYMGNTDKALLNVQGRKSAKYPAVIKFGDASGSVKGAADLKHITFKLLK
jgi:Glycosyl hydrolase-like 10